MDILLVILAIFITGTFAYLQSKIRELDHLLKSNIAELNTSLKDLSIASVADFQSLDTKIAGLKDHIAGLRSDVELCEKTLAEYMGQFDTDELSRMKDRLGFVELASGIRRDNKPKAV